MASTGDDGSETDSVPDDVFQRASSAVAGAEEEFQYAQDPYEDDQQRQTTRQRHSHGGSQDEADDDGSEDGADFSDDEDVRENRFDGPASTWRFYTESERNLAASLDQQRANDLGLHLYNAHALKASVRNAEAAAQAKHHQGKKQWMQADDGGNLPWHPDALWTAWPLRPADVPRPGEAYGVPVPSRIDEKATIRKPVSWKPSLDLEDEIQAIMLREAKESLSKHEGQASLTRSTNGAAQQSSPRKRKRSSTLSSTSPSTSVTANGPGVSEHDRRDHTGGKDDQRLEVLVDDEEVAEILQPSVRHVISKLDDLLLSLHRSRKGHVRESASPRSRARYERRKSHSRARSRAEAEGEDAGPDSGGTVDGQGLNAGSHTKSAGTSTAATPSSHDDTAGLESARMQKDMKKAKRKPPLNPRDWSEVLGIASLVGWDAEVVRRASERCSSLFEEAMAFREVGQAPKEVAVGNEGHESATIVEEAEEVGFACPVDTCPRHSEPWPLNKTWRWREHLKRSHKYSKAAIEELEEALKSGTAGQEADGADAGETRAVAQTREPV